MKTYDENNVSLVTVSKDTAGRRIDNFLMSYLKGVTRNRIYRILRRGEIRVNKKRIKWIYRLCLKDVIRIPPIRNIILKKRITQLSEPVAKKLHDSFLYEDDCLIVLNKPSGMAVHGGTGLPFNIIEGLRILRPELGFLSLVHRLDQDTSGILLLAKNYFSLIALHQQLCTNKVKKAYLALVSGSCAFRCNIVDAPLLKKTNVSGLYTVQVDSILGKYSKTCFIVKERFIIATLLRVKPITGRTHQIRVHAQYMGNPIAFDERYGNVLFNKKLELSSGLNRLFLHASSIQFIHPKNGKIFYIEASMDKVLLDCLSFLRNKLKFN